MPSVVSVHPAIRGSAMSPALSIYPEMERATSIRDGPRRQARRPDDTPMQQRLGQLELSHRACCAWFVLLACAMALVPVKDYFLGSYVTLKFDEVRDDVVARKLNDVAVVTSSAHYFDTFSRDALPLFDAQIQARMTRDGSRGRALVDFLVHTSVRRADLHAALPEALLRTKISLMDDFSAPICGPTWQTDAQLLFGHYFPSIRHEFCREFGDAFPRDRFFTSRRSSASYESSSGDDIALAPLGVIGLVNMSEVYLRHFRSLDVVRTLTRSVLSGFLGSSNASSHPWHVDFSDATADAVVERFAGGITVAELIELLPDADDNSPVDSVRLVDLVGVKVVLAHFLTPQELSMGRNVNSEAAVIAEISFATNSVLTLDFLVTALGMGPVFSTYMAPFWNCGIELTTMEKDVALDVLDPDRLYQCGVAKASLVPAYIVNLLYLTQSSYRDYAKLDNTSLFMVGRKRVLRFDVPDKLASSPLLITDGAAWTKAKTLQQLPVSPTPFGYIYTRDCVHLVDEAFAQRGRNVQKYQAFIGDGIGNCHFHDSQETELQVLCRLLFSEDELLLRDLQGRVSANFSACEDLAPLASLEEQSNFRQIEWFLIDTALLAKRTRIRDNTSRQIRTSLLFLSLAGSIYYVYEYLVILKSVWVFTRNSLHVATVPRSSSAAKDRTAPQTIQLHELLRLDPTVGALQRPTSIVLLYLGAVGALSNIFSLACYAEIASADGKIVIFCRPSIALTSVSLCFTAMSSGFWVSLITQQTRSVDRRLRSQADPAWIRKWLLSHAAVLLIYVSCKLSTDALLQNVMLRSDPHLYAICGGVLMTILISTAFRAIHYSSRPCKSPATAVSDSSANARSPGGHQLSRYPSFSARTATLQESDFLSRWSAKQLDGVLQECASPTIALQLVWYCALRRSGRQAPLLQQSASAPRTDFVASGIRVHEFVAVHVAAGAWAHLETLAWSYDARGHLTIQPTE